MPSTTSARTIKPKPPLPPQKRKKATTTNSTVLNPRSTTSAALPKTSNHAPPRTDTSVVAQENSLIDELTRGAQDFIDGGTKVALGLRSVASSISWSAHTYGVGMEVSTLLGAGTAADALAISGPAVAAFAGGVGIGLGVNEVVEVATGQPIGDHLCDWTKCDAP